MKAPQRGIQSIEVGGALLRALAHHGRALPLKELAAIAGMSPAKAHPYLVSFGKLGLIEQEADSGRYGLGPLAMQLGLISLQQSDPVALATLYGDQAFLAMRASQRSAPNSDAAPATPPEAPLVLVVDDSLTVRRVTQRLLQREGYRVVLAKDGLDAIDKLAEELPAVVLSDIEMPRMDGFDLVRNLRADARLRALPVIMITSRIAQKHRDHAAELGVDHYLGKPYSEEDLLALVARYTASHASA